MILQSPKPTTNNFDNRQYCHTPSPILKANQSWYSGKLFAEELTQQKITNTNLDDKTTVKV